MVAEVRQVGDIAVGFTPVVELMHGWGKGKRPWRVGASGDDPDAVALIIYVEGDAAIAGFVRREVTYGQVQQMLAKISAAASIEEARETIVGIQQIYSVRQSHREVKTFLAICEAHVKSHGCTRIGWCRPDKPEIRWRPL